MTFNKSVWNLILLSYTLKKVKKNDILFLNKKTKTQIPNLLRYTFKKNKKVYIDYLIHNGMRNKKKKIFTSRFFLLWFVQTISPTVFLKKKKK